MLRLAGVTIPDNVDLYTGLRMVKGLDTRHSEGKVDRIITQSGLYKKEIDSSIPATKSGNVRKIRVYPQIGELTWKQKARLVDLVEIPRARLGSVRVSCKKLVLIADIIRGKTVDEALAILKFTPKAGAPELLKLLKSAIANASNNHEIKAGDLFVAKVIVDGGPTMKRFMARARGRACRIRKRSSSIKIVLREKFKMPKVKAKGETSETSQKAPATTTKAKTQGGEE